MIEAFELRPDGYWWGPAIGEGDVLDYTLDFRNLFVADPKKSVDPLVSVEWILSDGVEMDESKNELGETHATIWLQNPDPTKAPFTVSCDVVTVSGRSAKRAFKIGMRSD